MTEQNDTAVTADRILAVILSAATRALGSSPSPTDNLYDLGLDSLSALELCALVEDEITDDCTPDDVMGTPIPVDLAALLADRGVEIIGSTQAE
ncbi:acyl carrier protein [Nocardia sp. NPDC051929]|uniref:acyl carrier protein n=1 Tax=Nocardia sp. NPDC051929 TaxID=3364327 RepID=UPI0037C6FF0C